MKFHDPQRPRLANSTPCWLTQPDHALPRPNLTPWPDNEYRYSIEVIIDGSQKIIAQSLFTVSTILFDWYEDPEHALEHWWHVKPPTGAKLTGTALGYATRVNATLEDLGL